MSTYLQEVWLLATNPSAVTNIQNSIVITKVVFLTITAAYVAGAFWIYAQSRKRTPIEGYRFDLAYLAHALFVLLGFCLAIVTL